jgi:hypothetical protein
MEKAEAAHEFVSPSGPPARAPPPLGKPTKTCFPPGSTRRCVCILSAGQEQCRIACIHAARSTGPVACVVLTFTRMRTDQPLRRTVDGGLTHRRGSHEDHKDPDPPRIPHPSDPARDMCARVLRNADVGDDPAKSTSYLTSEHITFKPTHIEFTHAAFTTWILCAPRPKFNPVVP